MSEYIIEYLPDTTSIEREEIVRCRDCKHRYGCVHLIEVIQEDGDGDMIRCETSPDCYCSWGERA